jgi:hypothetical protein
VRLFIDREEGKIPNDGPIAAIDDKSITKGDIAGSASGKGFFNTFLCLTFLIRLFKGYLLASFSL